MLNILTFKFFLISALYSSAFGASGDHSELFLTPHIKSGDLAKARELSSDHLKDFHIKSSTNENLKSYSGYLTIDEEKNSNLFFWFFPALESPEKAPVIMWLNEVAGSSCLKGIFLENGPFYVDDNLALKDRNTTWVRKNSMLYLDAPVGAGFSFTDKEEGYANNSEDDAEEVFAALQQFFQLFSEFKDRDFYFAGEGLSANHIPRMVKRVEAGNMDNGKININLKGFLIGAPMFNSKIQMNWAESWFSLGLVDEQQQEIVKKQQIQMVELIDAKKLLEAHDMAFRIIFTPTSSFVKFTGNFAGLNVLNVTNPKEIVNFARFINDKEVHNYLHAGLHKFEIFNFKVHDKFNPEIMTGDGKALESVLDNYKVLLYSGQTDTIFVPRRIAEAINALNWSGAADYKKAPRKVWRVGNDVAGYVKSTGKFNYAMIRKAGRYAMMDQPEWGAELIQNFIDDKPLVK